MLPAFTTFFKSVPQLLRYIEEISKGYRIRGIVARDIVLNCIEQMADVCTVVLCYIENTAVYIAALPPEKSDKP